MTETSTRVLPRASDLVERAAREARVLRGAVADYLADLIRIPTDNPPGDCREAAARVQRELAALGLGSERIDVDWPEGPGPVPIVLAWLGPRTLTPALLLNAHVDASPPGDGWTVDPYAAERRNGRIYGRGATLSKADVAAYTYAVAAAARALNGAARDRTVVLAITADEGSGGERGPRHLLEAVGLRPERAICAGFTHAVGIAHDGCVQIKVTIEARATHTAFARPSSETMRAVAALARRAFDVDAELRDRPCDIPGIASPTLSVTRIRGGEWFGLAPGRAELWLDRRVTPEEDPAAVLEQLRLLVGDTLAGWDAAATVEVAQVAQPLRVTEAQNAWAAELQLTAAAVLGHAVPQRGVPLYTDARWFGAHGVPTVLYGAGAGDLLDTGANGSDENVHEQDLADATEVLARVVSAVAGDPN